METAARQYTKLRAGKKACDFVAKGIETPKTSPRTIAVYPLNRHNIFLTEYNNIQSILFSRNIVKLKWNIGFILQWSYIIYKTKLWDTVLLQSV